MSKKKRRNILFITDTSLWKAKELSIFNLAKFCSQHFNWKMEEILKKKFENILWKGVFLQMLYSICSNRKLAPIHIFIDKMGLFSVSSNQM
jgi:hypothetical protein